MWPLGYRAAVVTVTFLASLQDFQEERMKDMADRLRTDHPDWTVEIRTPAESQALLEKHKLQFGPAILVNGRIEFVGIPRYRMLIERVAMVAAGRASPRTAQPPPASGPAAGAKAAPAASPGPSPPPG
jgi:hypothetical protein